MKHINILVSLMIFPVLIVSGGMIFHAQKFPFFIDDQWAGADTQSHRAYPSIVNASGTGSLDLASHGFGPQLVVSSHEFAHSITYITSTGGVGSDDPHAISDPSGQYHPQHIPFTYDSFDPCRFNLDDFNYAGISVLAVLYRDRDTEHFQGNTESYLAYHHRTTYHHTVDIPYTSHATCTYTSTRSNNPHWELLIEKVTQDNKPDLFRKVVTEQSNHIMDVQSYTKEVSGHYALVEERTYKLVAHRRNEKYNYQGTMCYMRVAPGVSYQFWDRAGDTSPGLLCKKLTNFMRLLIYV